MLHLIKERYGADFSNRIADLLVLPRASTVGEVQRVPNHVRVGTRNGIHLQTLEFMAANIEKPFTTPQIAKMIGVSVRQVESASRCPARILWATFAHGFWDGRAHVTRIDSTSKAVPTKRRPRNWDCPPRLLVTSIDLSYTTTSVFDAIRSSTTVPLNVTPSSVTSTGLFSAPAPSWSITSVVSPLPLSIAVTKSEISPPV